MGEVYLISDGEYFKIGFTTIGTPNRVKLLQTGCPNEITIIATYESYNYRKLESWLHRKYKNLCVGGEWFDLDTDIVSNFLNEAKKIDSNINTLKDNPFF